MTVRYVYVASSWKNHRHPSVVQAITGTGIGVYDFRNPDGGKGFARREVALDVDPVAGTVPLERYLAALQRPRAVEGFDLDFAAMQRADAFVLVLPCGRSAHLKLGWAVGAGKRTAILLEAPCTPELMYSMVDYLAPSIDHVIGWLHGLPAPSASEAGERKSTESAPVTPPHVDTMPGATLERRPSHDHEPIHRIGFASTPTGVTQ